jgi:hypothetical protein
MLRTVPLPRTPLDKSWSLDSLDGLEELTGLTAYVAYVIRVNHILNFTHSRLLLDSDGRFAPERAFAGEYEPACHYTPPPSPPPTRWPSPTISPQSLLPSRPLVDSPSSSPRTSALYAEHHHGRVDSKTPRPTTRLLPPPGLRRCVSDAPLNQSEPSLLDATTSANSSPGLALHLRKRAWTATPSPSPPSRGNLPLPVVDDDYERMDKEPGTPLPPRKRVRTRATTPESPTFIPLGPLGEISVINADMLHVENKPVHGLLDNTMEVSSG